MLKKVGVAILILIGLFITSFNTVGIGEKEALEEKVTEMAIYEPIAVLELFTSQGCSSCPSADVLLEKAKQEFPKNVYALSYHVDYWNYIGWEDPFSKPTYAKKQRKYNVKFKNRTNYTPQLVINGKEHFVGSSKTKVYTGIDKYQKIKTGNRVEIKHIKVNSDIVTFDYMVEGKKADKTLRALLVLDERTTSVKRGENRNRTLKNSNIVVAEKTKSLNLVEESMTISIPKIVKPEEKVSLILIIENTDYDITAAAKQSIDRR